MKKIFRIALLSFVLGGCAVGDIKEPSFSVVQKEGDIEIRQYAPMIIAEVTMTGDRKEAINNGFRALADYIFGNNDGKQEIAMTAPVTQQADKEGAKIAMTAPVTQQSSGDNTWKVHFVMPSEYTMSSIPKPENPAVKLMEKPSYQAAIIRFSGLAGEEKLEGKTQDLQKWITTQNLKAVGEPVYAYYNPPWTLPFMRRNEVMIDVQK